MGRYKMKTLLHELRYGDKYIVNPIGDQFPLRKHENTCPNNAAIRRSSRKAHNDSPRAGLLLNSKKNADASLSRHSALMAGMR